jgi:hypothetical protein
MEMMLGSVSVDESGEDARADRRRWKATHELARKARRNSRDRVDDYYDDIYGKNLGGVSKWRGRSSVSFLWVSVFFSNDAAGLRWEKLLR